MNVALIENMVLANTFFEFHLNHSVPLKIMVKIFTHGLQGSPQNNG
jgi:hypothetical protein